MKNMAKDLCIGDTIDVAGVPCKVRGVQENFRGAIILNLRIKGLPHPSDGSVTASKKRQRAQATLIVHRKTLFRVKA